MKVKYVIFGIVLLSLILNGCSSATKTQQEKEAIETPLHKEAVPMRDDFGCFPPLCSDISDPIGRQMCDDWKAGKNVTWPPDCNYSPTEECKKLCNAEKQKFLPEPPQQLPLQNEQMPEKPVWKFGGIAIAGQYADADIVDLGNGKHRMYYSAEPEVSGFEGQLYSAVSSDGVTWAQEDGIRKNWAVFPSVIRLSDGNYRLYFQDQGAIKSAVSADGISWTDESGIRVDASNNIGLKLENAAAPTVMKIGDAYVMVYRSTINEKYPAKVPNNNIQLLLWAISNDGLVFEKKGIALDSRDPEFQGLSDGPELVGWDDNSIRLYFWSYKGVYHITYKGGKFSQNAEFDYTTNDNPQNPFPENPPGDPALARINGKWFMYYGQHGKGIYYASFRSVPST